MKTTLLSIVFAISFTLCLGQGRNISFKKKIKNDVILSSKDTLKINDLIELQEGSTEKGIFKFIQLLNNFNEPIELANSRSAFTKQRILYFKMRDSVIYAFTKFYCINIESAVKSNEIKCSSIKKLKPDQKDNSKYDKLIKIKQLLDDGIITQEEYEKEKKKILQEN